MRFHRVLGLGIVLILLAVFASPAGAQLANSSISGTVTGADGAGLPGVTVTLKNQESGLVRTSVSLALRVANAPTRTWTTRRAATAVRPATASGHTQ